MAYNIESLLAVYYDQNLAPRPTQNNEAENNELLYFHSTEIAENYQSIYFL